MQQPWHSKTVEEVLENFNTTKDGLKQKDIALRIEKYGANKLKEQKKQSIFVRFMMQFHNLLIYVLLAAAGITMVIGHKFDSFVILSVVLINAIIGFIQENRAQNAMDAIKKMLAFSAVVLRDGHKVKIDSQMIVPGDVVFLEAGDRVLADMRIISAHGFSVQEAPLTGESNAVEKSAQIVDEKSALGDRASMVFAGTMVASGRAVGVVVATANFTELGKIDKMLRDVEVLTTPLVAQMDTFAKWLTVVILSISLLIFLVGFYLKDMGFDEIFMAVVGLFVAAIPEGLPAVLTITLAVGVQAMANRHAIVRHLPAIETIGAVSVICTDKTGTLTQNEMMVCTVISHDKTFIVKGHGYEPIGDILYDEKIVQKDDFINHLAKMSLLCNDAELYKEDDIYKIGGSPTEAALVAFGQKVGFHTQELRESFTREDMIAFDSKHKYMATLHNNHKDISNIIIKGAPEVLIHMCDYQYKDDTKAQPINIKYWEEKAKEIAKKGQRVLAVGYKKTSINKTELTHDDLKDNLILIGLLGLIDPPREEAKYAVLECHSASIEVKMITGDHAMTAAAIGKMIGLKNCEEPLCGSDIEKLTDKELQDMLHSHDIFARTTPEHKLRIVSALQANQKVVAMTGDGVNDAPALKRANVGVAMGITGTEAAKEASEFVLADDNFASIVSAVREGRRVYDNIKKVIRWTLPTNASEAFIVIAAILLGITMPISPIQILWVNMVTAVTLGIALAFEKEDKDIMQRVPRGIDEPILDRVLVWQILLVTTLFVSAVFLLYAYSISENHTTAYAQTLSLNTLVILEAFYLFYIRNHNTIDVNLKSFIGTKVVWIAVGILFVAQLIITYMPWMQMIFKTEGITLFDFGLIFLVGFVMLGILELEKQVRLRRRGSV